MADRSKPPVRINRMSTKATNSQTQTQAATLAKGSHVRGFLRELDGFTLLHRIMPFG